MTLGEMLAPHLEELGLVPNHKFHLEPIDCLMEDGCECCLCVPPLPDFNNWMYRTSESGGCVAATICSNRIELIDYVSETSIAISVFDINIMNKITKIVEAQKEFLMNPYEPLKQPEHIIGFKKEAAPSPETLRKAGFKAHDVIAWTRPDGKMFLQNGEEYLKLGNETEDPYKALKTVLDEHESGHSPCSCLEIRQMLHDLTGKKQNV
jgi:hypothetical protein